MTKTQVLQEIRRMRFEEAYGGWQERRLTQEEAARLLGVCERTFRRYVERYEDEGLDGLVDKRLGQVSARRAPVDEVVRTETLYRERYEGWNVRHFYSFYRRRHAGTRSYTWVKNTLQRAGLVAKVRARGKHRRRRERAPLRGMMLHQDGSTHQWVPGSYWDLIVTLDDATSEHLSMFFVEEEGTASSFQAMTEVIAGWGLPSSLYTDRASHYWTTPEAGGKVDREHRTQFGRAMRQLGVEMIPAYSAEARGRSERMFATHQERLPKELAAAGIDTMPEANRYLAEHYRAAFNEEFTVPAAEPGSAFVSFIGPGLADILCEHHERTVTRDHCVSFEAKRLQIPAQMHRRHFIKAKVRVHRYPDGRLAVFHGPRKLADYEPDGSTVTDAPVAGQDRAAHTAVAR